MWNQSPKPDRLSIHPPQTFWIFVLDVVLIFVGIWFQFGLPVYRQQVAIREIERVGGSVETRNAGPIWLRYWLGDERMELFDDVVRVSLDFNPAADAALGHVARISSLEELSLNSSEVSDKGLSHLKG